MDRALIDSLEQLSGEWESVLARLSVGSPVRPVIRESWERCRSLGLDRDGVSLPWVGDDELERRRDRGAALLATVGPHLDWLSAALAAVPHRICFVDADGVVLHCLGTAADSVVGAGLAAGYRWAEAAAGTSAAGTALAVGTPLAVVGPEHFALPLAEVTGVAAPVRGREGSIEGAILLVTPNLAGVADRLALVAYGARAVEGELAARRSGEGWGEAEWLDRVSRAVRESEARFRATFEQAAVGIAHVDLDGRWIRVNGRLCEILGYPRDRLLELTFQAITHRDDLDRDLALVDRLLRGEIESYAMEKRYVRPDGSHVWANLTVSLSLTAEGAPEHFISVIEDIRQRKEAEARLVAAERHLRGVIDSMFAFVGVTTPEGVLVEANRAALEAAGLRPEDVLGRPFEETYWWAYDASVQRQLRAAIERAAAGESSRYDVMICLGPGTLEPIDFMLSPLRDEHGLVTHLVPSAIVITERVQAEAALRQSEARLRTALAAARMGTWDISLESGEVHRSESTDVIFGLPADGEPRRADAYFGRVHPDDVQRVQESIALTLEAEVEHLVEYRIVLPDGAERWVRSRGELIRDEAGRPLRLAGALVDDTTRVETERALRESEARFRTLADNIPQLAWMADAAGQIFWYNRRWSDYTGKTLEDMRSGAGHSVHHPEWAEGVAERFRAAVAIGVPWEDTIPLRSADGEYRWFLSRAVPIRDERDRVVRWFGTDTDITEQRASAAERERLFEQADAANRAKSEFMAIMSHELRTPLNAIIGYTDLLQLGAAGALQETATRYVERIRSAANHQMLLIEDVLAFSRLEAGREAVEVQPVRIPVLVEEITAVISPLAERKGLVLVTDARDAPEVLLSDDRKLRQILVNLLGNAVKFTTEGHVALRIEGTRHGVLFTVADTGAGVPAEHLDRIFEPFWQGDRSLTRSAEGTGLGLSISQRFARMLGGDIRVESAPGVGSTFTVLLPREPGSAPLATLWTEAARGRR